MNDLIDKLQAIIEHLKQNLGTYVPVEDFILLAEMFHKVAVSVKENLEV